MRTTIFKFSAAPLFGLLLFTVAGCQDSAIDANNQMLKEQQVEIERMQRQIEGLQATQSNNYVPGVSPPPGGCDRSVQAIATRSGGDRFAAGDFAGALGYYQDALTACPGDAQAEVNVARAYEAIGDKQRAVEHYRVAANPTNGTIGAPQEQARDALLRLDASQLP
ncbi:MAG TPA: hypothetical protein VMU16_13260 [Candidatus Binataceae bacterium]|nr:hypothetical protein [Candidatus Binataceae bacterium]